MERGRQARILARGTNNKVSQATKLEGAVDGSADQVRVEEGKRQRHAHRSFGDLVCAGAVRCEMAYPGIIDDQEDFAPEACADMNEEQCNPNYRRVIRATDHGSVIIDLLDPLKRNERRMQLARNAKVLAGRQLTAGEREQFLLQPSAALN